MSAASDMELLERWRGGDLDAGEALFDRYYLMVERFFANKLASGVDDMVQETFKVCVESRDKVTNPDKFRSFVLSIAYHVFCAHLRQRYSAGKREMNFDEISVHSLSPSPSSMVAHRREQRLLLQGLRAIPVDYQVILEMHYWEDMTTEEMGAALATPVGTIRSRLRRAREHLHEAMTRLALSREELESTLSQLDDWARQCRRSLA